MRFAFAQFSLRQLMLFTTLCAIGVGWWMQRQRYRDESAANDVAHNWSEVEAECRHNDLQIMRQLDWNNATHRQALSWLRTPLFLDHQRHEIRGRPRMEVVIFRSTFFSIPGSQESIVALLRDNRLIDLFVYESSTRMEFHSMTVVDADADGVTDVVLTKSPGFSSRKGKAASIQVIYSITPDGFRLCDTP